MLLLFTFGVQFMATEKAVWNNTSSDPSRGWTVCTIVPSQGRSAGWWPGFNPSGSCNATWSARVGRGQQGFAPLYSKLCRGQRSSPDPSKWSPRIWTPTGLDCWTIPPIHLNHNSMKIKCSWKSRCPYYWATQCGFQVSAFSSTPVLTIGF